MELSPMEIALNLLALTGQALRFTAYTVAGVTCLGLVYFGPSLLNFFVLQPCKSYLRLLPGPKRRGAFACDLGVICDAETSHEFNERLKKKYGRNIRAQGYGYMDDRLITYDPVAINYILNQEADRYTKPWPMRRIISKLTGGDTKQNAVSVAEGAYHHRLRKIILPAFAPSTVKSHAAVFTRKANEVCEHWRSALSEPVVAAPGIEFDEKNAPLVDVHNWFSRAAFDVVGLAAFGYSFNSLRDDSNELFATYMRLHHATRNMTPRDNLCLLVPWLERIWQTDNSRMAVASGLKVQSMSKKLLEQRRALTPEGDSKSILGLLLRSNSKAEPEDRLTDEQLLAQIDSFMFGGADTTSLVITWALYELACHPEVQNALRAELKPLGLNEHSSEQHEFGSDSGIDFDLGPADPVAVLAAIDALPVLDRVVREVVRLHPPVHSTLRVAEHDDIIPISPDAMPLMPDGSVSRAIVTGMGADGVQRTGIKIRKGELIHPQIEVLNTCRDVWGDDGFEFNPDRWLNLPPATKNNIGIFSGLMTFSVGPHSCPASRFAVAEVKTMLAYVISSFEFEKFAKIQPHNMMVTRPYVDDEWENGFRLPLRVRAV